MSYLFFFPNFFADKLDNKAMLDQTDSVDHLVVVTSETLTVAQADQVDMAVVVEADMEVHLEVATADSAVIVIPSGCDTNCLGWKGCRFSILPRISIRSAWDVSTHSETVGKTTHPVRWSIPSRQ